MTRLIMPVLVSALLMSAARAYAQDATVTPKDVMVYGMKIHYLEAGRGAPVILLHGSGGEGARWMPTIRGRGAANADRLNAAISGSRKIFIEKAGHYPFIEQPTQFNKAVLEFLAAAASTE
jgi:pimeloyl-ACP methyl ester carboxylesterase